MAGSGGDKVTQQNWILPDCGRTFQCPNKDMTYDDVLCTYVHYDTPKSKAASLAVSEKMRQ